MTAWRSPLRDLAKQLRDVAKNHFAYSQVVELMLVVDAHINALALIEEGNRMTMVDGKCDVCQINPPIGVASTMIPYSCAYCRDCAERNAQPDIVFATLYDTFSDKYDLMHDGMPDALLTFKDGKYISYREWATWRKNQPEK